MHTLEAQQHRHTKSRRGVTRSMAVLSAMYNCKMLAKSKTSRLDYYKEKKGYKDQNSLWKTVKTDEKKMQE